MPDSNVPESRVSTVLLEAVRADVRARVERIVDDLEVDLEAFPPSAVDVSLHRALARMTEAVAEGIVAHVRERRGGEGNRPPES
jgi:hypothetical protein